ncbi:hypothetical protein SAMN02949497_4296 [Methylomagnum ishizawai]|uniref:Uncharacterized protein n=1 Tax=Methylomagnum ishizawai TaxID=1760988 RepID=A0A1Y6D8Z8_9GAMM|nr:hypothetical protein [Methylomagnum ishizawai]SMF96882.1 hypothetical protein SAMN02949497_4296 [Methylomagnum ishizawai]
MGNIPGFLLSLLEVAGVSAIISSAIVWLTSNWIGERLKNAIKHEYDLKLSKLNHELKSRSDTQAMELKSTIEKEAEALKFAMSFVGEAKKVVISRKLDGVDVIWASVLNARKFAPLIMSFIEVTTEEQYREMRRNPNTEAMFGNIAPENIKELIEDKNGAIERVRPYVGEYLWAIYSTYISLTTIIILMINNRDKNPTSIINWHQDSSIQEILKSSLSAEETIDFSSVRIGKLGWLKSLYESKILQAIQMVMAGQEFGAEALKQAQAMEETIQRLKHQNWQFNNKEPRSEAA